MDQNTPGGAHHGPLLIETLKGRSPDNRREACAHGVLEEIPEPDVQGFVFSEDPLNPGTRSSLFYEYISEKHLQENLQKIAGQDNGQIVFSSSEGLPHGLKESLSHSVGPAIGPPLGSTLRTWAGSVCLRKNPATGRAAKQSNVVLNPIL